MNQIAIFVEGLSKEYTIGRRKRRYDTFQEAVIRTAKAPFERILKWREPENDDTHIWALKDVSFEIKEGEVVGVIGRNGAGKSTLLKILSRITEPSHGRAEIRGRVASLLEVGTGFHPELTGRENVYLNGTILGMKKREINKKFDEIVSFAELEKLIDTPVKHYSSGMYIRLAFAVAAHLHPEVLLVDEVLAVGDAGFQKRCLGKMDEVAKEGRTVIYVSHNLLSLENLCTRGILLDLGKLEADGRIGEVIRQYMDSGKAHTGEISWPSPETSPGDHRARLKAMRIISEGRVTGEIDISREFTIEIDYWNLEEDSRRLVSFHLSNSLGACILTSGNYPDMPLRSDPWYQRQYPRGLFRTTCTIPGGLLNDGLHNITLYLNEKGPHDNIIIGRDILSFVVRDTDDPIRKHYTGPWIGAVRVRLDWKTSPLGP